MWVEFFPDKYFQEARSSTEPKKLNGDVSLCLMGVGKEVGAAILVAPSVRV